MAYNDCFIDANPERVFAVLADASSYERWVVGAREIRAADAGWPKPGSRLHHSVGFGPIALKDDTKVIQSDRPRHLLLKARGRPFGTAHIDFTLTADGGGSRVELRERVVAPRVLAALNPVFAPLVRARNTETLRRLSAVVAGSKSTEADI